MLQVWVPAEETMWRGLYTTWRDKGLPFHTHHCQTFEWSHLGTSRPAKLPLNNSHRCYMKQKNHPTEVIFSIKPLYLGTEDRPIDYAILISRWSLNILYCWEWYEIKLLWEQPKPHILCLRIQLLFSVLLVYLPTSSFHSVGFYGPFGRMPAYI